MKKNFDSIFKAKSIAIIGASNKEGSIGNSLVNNVKKDFKGKIYPINLKENKVAGLKAYSSLSEVKEKIDLMLIAIPAKNVAKVLEEGGQLKIKSAIVISAGFKELGNIELEKELSLVCKKYNITLIGPNCLGVLNPKLGINASFAAKSAKAGNVAFISQSGAICTAILDSAASLGIGFSKFVSIGNKALVNEVDLFNYLLDDKDTKIIALYVEQLEEAQNFLSIVKKLNSASKPVIILKSGRSKAGAQASASHTGSLAGENLIYEALFSQAGVIKAEKIEELFDFIKIFNNNELKKANRVGIITNAGGPGVVAVDSLSDFSLELASLSEKTKKYLKNKLSVAASVNNPVDVLGDAKAVHYEHALKVVLNDSGVDSVLLILTPQAVTEIEETAKIIIDYKNKTKKPLAVVFMGEEMVASVRNIFKERKIASYSFPESAVKSLKALDTFYQQSNDNKKIRKTIFKEVDTGRVREIIKTAKLSGKKYFVEKESLEILEAYNFPTIPSFLARNKAEAIKIAKKINKNVVLKVSSPDILHKSDSGGVVLDIPGKEVGEVFDKMIYSLNKNKPGARIDGILIAEMIKERGVEMIIGSFRDPALGQSIMVGLGGIYVEVFKDIAFGINPLSFKDVQRMIDTLTSKKILKGVRGEKEKDLHSLIELVLRLSRLLTDFPEILELDINPLLVLEKGKGVKVLDARILIE